MHMKKFLHLKSLLIALFVLFGGGGVFAAVETITFSEQGYQNQQTISKVTGSGITITFNKGSNSNEPKYYNTGAAVRVYGGSHFTVTSDFKITKIVLSFSTGEGSNAIVTDVGNYSSGTWEGEANSVKFTIGGTSGHRRIASISVTYNSGQEQEKITPTLTFASEIVNLFVGETFTPSLTKPSGVDVTYSIDDETIATLYDTGYLEALKKGTATITATSVENDLYLSTTATFTLNVTDELSAVGDYEWVKDVSTLASGDELVIVYQTNDTFAKVMGNQDTNNFKYVDVNYANGITDKSVITIPQNKAAQATPILLEGSTEAWYFHTNNGYLYAASSSNNYLKTARIEDNGVGDNAKATINKADNGNATVVFQGSNTRNNLRFNSASNALLFSCYASSSDMKLVQLYRKVPSNVPPTVTFSPASGTEVNYGTQVTITARTATSIIYSVNGGEPVTVNGTSATVTINTHSTITATATNEFGTSEEATAEYTINQESSALSYNPAEYTITIGDDFTAPEVNKPEDYNGTITYSSDNTDVAEVNSTTGEVTIKAAGEANITASGTETEHYAAATASYKITVNKKASAVSFAEAVVEITYGDNYDKQKATTEGVSGNLVYTSSDESIVKFHGNNVIDVLKPGTVTITVTAPATDTTEESSATYTLKVYAPADAVEGSAEVLNEDFSACQHDIASWGGNNDFNTDLGDLRWETTHCQASLGYLKLGTANNAGSATSPAFRVAGEAPLSFALAPWVANNSSEDAKVIVTLANATFGNGEATMTLNTGNLTQREFTTFDQYTIVGNSDEVTITFSGDGGYDRFFLDNVVVGGGAQPAHEINLTFSSAGYLTWVATADIDFSQTEGVTAYQITEATSKKITMVEVDKVPAGAAVMLKGSGTKTLKRTTEEVADLSDNKMKACTDGLVTGNGNGVTNTDVYVLGNGKSGLGFYMLKGTLQAGKGYLQVSEGTGNAKPNFISFEETTGVKTVVINKDSDGEVYNLQGIRVAHPQKGIYVKNGKKYVIK